MTQEELDAMLNEGTDSITDEILDSEKKADNNASKDFDIDSVEYRANAAKEWPPPPPNNEHKVIHQLDDVTRDTEAKAGEIFDQLDIVDSQASQIAKATKEVTKHIKEQEALFKKLCDHFPHIQSFQTALSNAQNSIKILLEIQESVNACSDATIQAIDIMQFQDINRQRIERVINVMRALTQYMNSLFESKIDDDKRVASAVHIIGDSSKNIADTKEIEELIASFGQKK